MSVLRDFIDSNSHTVGGGSSRPCRRNRQTRNTEHVGTTMLVFGFHRGADFVNAEMALRRPGAPPCRSAGHCEGRRKRFSCPQPRSDDEAINAVFTRIVNDYSIVQGTAAIGPQGGGLHGLVNLGS
jgi:hypothetical protein